MLRRSYALVLVVVFAGPTALAKEGPLNRTRGLISAFKSVRTAPEGGSLSPAEKEANSRAYKQIDKFFGWDRLLGDLVAPHRDKFSEEQLERCKKVFKQLIRVIAYPDSGEFFRKAKYSLKKPTIAEKRAGVDMFGELVEEDLEITVTFHWLDFGSTWRIVDVSFDGASLVKDYQNQFGRIIDKEGVQGLLKRMEDRLREEQQSGDEVP